MKKTAISIFALLVLGVSYLFLFSQQSYKKTVVQYYANDQNLPNRIIIVNIAINEKPTTVAL